jgi:hypothetical protein
MDTMITRVANFAAKYTRKSSSETLNEFVEEYREQRSKMMNVVAESSDAEAMGVNDFEMKPTYHQVRINKIWEILDKDVETIRRFEVMLSARLSAAKEFSDSYASNAKSIMETRQDLDAYKNENLSLQRAIDALYAHQRGEVESQKADSAIESVKAELYDARKDAKKHADDYRHALTRNEESLRASESRLKKAQKVLATSMENLLKEERLDEAANTEVPKLPPMTGFGGILGTSFRRGSVYTVAEQHKHDEGDVKEALQELRHSLVHRDEVWAGSALAYQSLSRKNKQVMKKALKQIAVHERRKLDSRTAALQSFETAVAAIDLEEDEQRFITHNGGERCGVVMLSQALALVSDVAEEKKKKGQSKGRRTPTSPATSDSGGSPVERERDGAEQERLQRLLARLFSGADLASLQEEGTISGLNELITTTPGREEVVSGINQYRSRKTDVEGGFEALGHVFLNILEMAAVDSDTHSARVIMMLSQTFFRETTIEEAKTEAEAEADRPAVESEPDGDRDVDRSSGDYEQRRPRLYVKELVAKHRIWHAEHCRFWELALWQLVLEQLHTINVDSPWHDMTDVQRCELASQVHDVIFSQVVAISHSMKELRCDAKAIKSFIYRMCAVHQLSEYHRLMMLGHLSDQS